MKLDLAQLAGRNDVEALKTLSSTTIQPGSAQKLSTEQTTASSTGSANLVESFNDVFSEKVKVLSDLLNNRDEMDRRLASGEVENIHEVMIAAAKANFALNVGVQLRNLLLRAYNQLTQLR